MGVNEIKQKSQTKITNKPKINKYKYKYKYE